MSILQSISPIKKLNEREDNNPQNKQLSLSLIPKMLLKVSTEEMRNQEIFPISKKGKYYSVGYKKETHKME